MIDVYLSRKIRKTNCNPFGFVRYRTYDDACKAMGKLNGTKITECVISVSLAKYGRKHDMSKSMYNHGYGGQPKNISPFLKKRDGRSYVNVTRQTWAAKSECLMGTKGSRRLDGNGGKPDTDDSDIQSKIYHVEGKVCDDNFEWIHRSLIGEGLKNLNTENVGDRLLEEGDTPQYVRHIDQYKVLITFRTIEECDHAIKTIKDSMLCVVEDIRSWNVTEVCGVRRVWLELKGVLLHGWSLMNFTSIGEKWGKVVYAVEDTNDFRSAFVQIDTVMMEPISSWV